MRNWISVPYPCPDGFPKIGLRNMAGPIARSFRDLYPGMNGNGVTLQLAKGGEPRPLTPRDMPVIVVTHNNMRLIRAFLTHYRSLGVTRFLMVDDVSSDGTAELLAQQPDVDLYISNVRYRDACRGRLWRQKLVKKYGKQRWYLYVDPDEFLVYPGQQSGLLALVSKLEAAGIYHMPAPMLDMYPPGRVRDAFYDGADGTMPWNVASMYDGDGYTLTGDERSWKITGGVRKRAFGVDAQLIKYPLVYWGSSTNLNKNIHSPAPYWRNFHAPMGMLLHFKFFSDYQNDFQTVIKNAQHFNGGVLYQQILDGVAEPDELALEGKSSARFISPDDLVKQAFLKA
jgi:hypothetical protein